MSGNKKFLTQPLRFKRFKTLEALNSYAGKPGEPILNMTSPNIELRICDGETLGGNTIAGTSLIGVVTPIIITPANNTSDFDVSNELVITTSDFQSIMPDASQDTHIFSQYQILDVDSNVVYDSGEVEDFQSHTVPSRTLTGDLTYTIRVRHKGAALGFSRWSNDVTVTTALEGIIVTPTNTSPTDGITNRPRNNTLQGSLFLTDPDGLDVAVKSEWQIATDVNFTNIISTLERNVAPFNSISTGFLSYSTTYYWRVRYFGNNLGVSEWSTPTSYRVENAPPPPDFFIDNANFDLNVDLLNINQSQSYPINISSQSRNLSIRINGQNGYDLANADFEILSISIENFGSWLNSLPPQIPSAILSDFGVTQGNTNFTQLGSGDSRFLNVSSWSSYFSGNYTITEMITNGWFRTFRSTTISVTVRDNRTGIVRSSSNGFSQGLRSDTI